MYKTFICEEYFHFGRTNEVLSFFEKRKQIHSQKKNNWTLKMAYTVKKRLATFLSPCRDVVNLFLQCSSCFYRFLCRCLSSACRFGVTLAYLHTQIKHKLYSKLICALHKTISSTYPCSTLKSSRSL
jgi:hypothetical protein